MNKFFKKAGIAFCLNFSISMAHASLVDSYFKEYLKHQDAENNNSAPHIQMSAAPQSIFGKDKNITEHYYQEQAVDHHDASKGTYAQRYFIDESFSTSNYAPVFLAICGEGTCGKRELLGAIRTLAEKYHAKLIAIEHRYYGKSQPRPTLSTENLRYLTTEQALADLAQLQDYLVKTQHWNGKWVAFGGSYAGSLSAYYRMKYPDHVVGALASSAPVMAKEEVDFDSHVTKMAGERCAKNMRNVIREIEFALYDEKRMAEIKKMFGASDIKDNLDFLDLVSTIGSGAIQYGMKNEFCAALNVSGVVGATMRGYADFAKLAFYMFGVKPVMLTEQGAISENPNDYTLIGTRQWIYQVCTEYGYCQTANPDPSKSVQSSLNNLSSCQDSCRRLFNIKKKPNTEYINANFYQPLFKPTTTNIYFTNGTVDFWSLLSIPPVNGNITNYNIDYTLIEGGSHCSDLSSPHFYDSRALKNARIRLDNLIEKWLR